MTTSPKKIAKALRKELGYHPNDVREYEEKKYTRNRYLRDKNKKIVLDKNKKPVIEQFKVVSSTLKDTCSRFFYQQEKQIKRSATNG